MLFSPHPTVEKYWPFSLMMIVGNHFVDCSLLYTTFFVYCICRYNKALNAWNETWDPTIINPVQCLLPLVCNREVSCSDTERLNLFLVTLGSIRKIVRSLLVVSSRLSVCLSVRMEQLGSHWMDFHEIWCLRVFFSKVFAENSRFITIWQELRVLYMEIIHIFVHTSLCSAFFRSVSVLLYNLRLRKWGKTETNFMFWWPCIFCK
jgi:hypothetical protein